MSNEMKTASRAAQLVNAAVNLSRKRQSEITKEAGYSTSNNITMIKQGKSRIALNKVEPLAKALDLDPVVLMDACLQEYEPAVFNFIKENRTVLTPVENKVLNLFREICGEDEPHIDEEKEAELKAVFMNLLI